jgi:hypothetical protein
MNKVFTLLSNEHQKEVGFLQHMKAVKYNGYPQLAPAVISRLSWLEYQAELKAKKLINFCNGVDNDS